MEKFLYKDILLILISFISTFFIYKKCIPLFSLYFVDIPNVRSLHKYKTPTGGGIIFAILISIFSLFKGNYIPIICLPISIIGLIDDKLNLSQKFRFIIQIITTILLLITFFSCVSKKSELLGTRPSALQLEAVVEPLLVAMR